MDDLDSNAQENLKWYGIYKGLIIAFSILNFIPLLFLIRSRLTHYRYHRNSNMSHLEILQNKGIWLDLFYTFDQVVISVLMLKSRLFESFETQIDNYEIDCKRIRYFEVFGLLLIYVKMSSFLSLFDELAPLMDIIWKICSDMKYFVLIFCTYIIGISSCFFLIGHNQIEFDNISEFYMSKYGVPYSTTYGSLWFVFDNFVLGNTNTDPFLGGDMSQRWILFPLCIFSSFLMLIHLLNMLIAIMGNTFAERSQVAEEIKSKDHLVFVLDNWHLLDKAFTNMKDARYIIAAMYADLDITNEQKVLDEIDSLKSNMDQFKQLNIDLSTMMFKQSQKISDLSSKVNDALKINNHLLERDDGTHSKNEV